MFVEKTLFISFLCCLHLIKGLQGETLPVIGDDHIPQSFEEMWKGFDPCKEPLEIEILKEWEQDGVILKVLRFRIGLFKGKKAMMAGVFGFPKGANQIPGLLQIHGGGQYADYKAPLTNAKRGYATLSIAWAGRVSAPGYRVSPGEVKLFWDGEIKNPLYKLTTDWGVLDAYHAPSRFGVDAFNSIPTADWTMDSIESPRNNSWFLITLAARRALTFLECQPQVDPDKLGVYGHSMGGKLTVLTAGSDKRVKAAAPSCGGISDRYSSNRLHLATVSDPPSLKRVTCPIIFLSPSNDFHGRINDLETATKEVQSKDWRITSSPHHNHQDTGEYEVATQLWFDQYLKNTFSFPKTPKLTLNLSKNKIPAITVDVDESNMLSVDVFYTQQGQVDGQKDDSTNTKNRFWNHAVGIREKGKWTADLPIFSLDKPLWVYANVAYKLNKPITGAGYYYGLYETNSFVLSSVMQTAISSDLESAQVLATSSQMQRIEDFMGGWKKEWFTYNPDKWGIKTHKVYDPVWAAPRGAVLEIEVSAELPNQLVVGLDNHSCLINLAGNGKSEKIRLHLADFKNVEGQSLANWHDLKELRLDEEDTLKPKKGSNVSSKKIGGKWKGAVPQFKSIGWVLP